MASALVRRARALLAALGLLVIVVHATPLTYWWAALLAGPDPGLSGEVLLVPTGAVHPDGVIGLGAYWRAVYARNVWRSGRASKILLSGGGAEKPHAAEAVVVRDFLIGSGIPESAIVVETESMSTRENALLSAPLAARLPGRKLLLTSDYHMYRALATYRAAGIVCEPLPVPDIKKRSLISWRNRGQAFLDLCIETAKIAYYAGRGWI